MRFLEVWWRTLVFSTQHNPPELIELIMTGLAIALLLSWNFTYHWSYLVLSSSFATGAAVSMWIRATSVPSPQQRVMQMLACLLLVYSVYAFSDVAPYLHHL